MTAIAISIYDGSVSWSYYIDDFKDADDMIKTALSSIFINKYKNHKVYIHNLSSFDSVFLLRILNSVDVHTKLTLNKGKIVNWQIIYDHNCYISLRDSLLLLPLSLAKLSYTFNTVDQRKDFFPILFLSGLVDIEPSYVGEIPDFK